MTPDPQSQPDQDAQSKRAAQLLRDQADERWVEISDRVLEKALRVTRRSMPVRAASAGGPVNVSEQVLIAGIRQALEPVTGAIPTDIKVHSDERNNYTGVLICLTADYGSPILPVADDIRNRTEHALTRMLGVLTPPVTVSTMHVHIDDVRQNISTDYGARWPARRDTKPPLPDQQR